MEIAGFEVDVARGSSRGRALLLLHGFTGNSSSWREVIAHLPRTTTIAAANLPGHHPKTPVDPTGGFAGAVDALAGLVRGMESALGVARGGVHVAGYSLGGRFALGMIARHGELFERATLIGASAGLETAEERSRRAARDASWIELLRRQGTRTFVATWERQPLLRARPSLPRERLEEQRATRLAHDAGALADSLEHHGLARMPAYWSTLAKISIPVRAIAGAEDTRFVALATKIAAMIPSAELAVVPNAGHNVLLDQPEVLAKLLALPCPA